MKCIKAILSALVVSSSLLTASALALHAQDKVDPFIEAELKQIKNALTRMLTRFADYDDKLTNLDADLVALQNVFEKSLQGEVADLRSSIEDIKVTHSDGLAEMNSAIEKMENGSQKITSEISVIKSQIEFLEKKLIDIEKNDRYRVVQANDGFAQVFQFEDLDRVQVNVSEASECSEAGQWLVNKVPMRDFNTLFVREPDGFSTCKLVGSEWLVVDALSSDAGHVVYLLDQ